MKEHIKRVDRILKYKGSILDIYTDVIETPDGHRAEWDYIDHRGAAAVVPVLDDGRLLMVRQYRDALDRETIEIPAGGLNGWDEPTINAAARELEEETGYRSDNLTKLVSVVTAVAFCNEVVDVYLATDLVKTSQHLDEDEFIDVEKYTLDELKDMIFAGTIQDSKTISAVLAYDALLNRKRIIKTKSSYIDSKYILMDIYEGFLLWVIKNVRFAALIIAGIILGTCFIKMWHYGDVFSTEYLIVYINSNAAYANVWQEVLSYRLRKFITLVVFMITPFRKLYVYWLCLYNGFCLGICMTKAVMYHGAGGVVMVLVWLFPHYLLYIMTVLLMCHYFLNRIDTLRRTVIIVSMSLLLTLIGTFTESYINPDIMKMFLNKVCNIV